MADQSLTEFLLARIAEDEAKARAVVNSLGLGADPSEFPSYPFGSEDAELTFMRGPGHPLRLLAECEAKRRIVDEHQPAKQHADELLHGYPQRCITCGQLAPRRFPCATLRALAVPYASRPDYQQEWAV